MTIKLCKAARQLIFSRDALIANQSCIAAWMACILHLPERTYCSPYFSHLPSEVKKILLVSQDRNANLNLLMIGTIHLILGASVFLKQLTDCSKWSLTVQTPGCREVWATSPFRLTVAHSGIQWGEFGWMVVSYHVNITWTIANTDCIFTLIQEQC